MLKAKKKKKSGQRKKEIKKNQIKKFRPENTKIKIKTQQMPQEKRTDEKINELEDRTIGMTQSKQQKVNRKKLINEQSLRSLQDYFKKI